MYESKNRQKDELREHLPEWTRILQDYFSHGYEQYLLNRAKYQVLPGK